MKNAGAILIGTNNLNEFASGINGINPLYGSSKNPWNTSRISGGSSGGSSLLLQQVWLYCLWELILEVQLDDHLHSVGW